MKEEEEEGKGKKRTRKRNWKRQKKTYDRKVEKDF